jgi:TatD DNase family protein
MQFDIHTHRIDKSYQCLFNSELSAAENGFFSAGIHPWKADQWSSETKGELTHLIAHPNCVAVGEIGLDKLKGPSLQIQLKCFEEQLLVAETSKVPVILHSVRSWNEIRIKATNSSVPIIWHGFNRVKLLDDVIASGLCVSLGKDLLINISLQDAIRNAPIDRIFLETDDSPIQIDAVYRKLAELKELTLAELEHQITKNIHNVFPKWIIGLNAQNY